ncbi:MAG: dipicolinate synthase subunit DpsA [Candidatus Improbicoccus pseudotrichonymphae]|uniref:Dipicolinate synthase subunit DpsA n=1 Tax=Candidatus Improbicoccus pseudotrichonymphae TaxID=3033792 RepID=A0AA48KXD0_9FIRM|nr:MAG: dipicolinate synthase subunit DpsA [Candidatus Improbicoccus pseudotrichonymphae]
MKDGSFVIIGGDKRQIFLASLLKEDGKKVHVCEFNDEIPSEINLKSEKLGDVIDKSNNIILPLPLSRDGRKVLFTDIELNISFIEKIKNKKIFCGNKNSIKDISWQNLDLIDYAQNENFKILNAEPTAEGTIKLLLENTDKTINNCSFLITGFGRIGKILSGMLKNFNAKIYINTKSEDDKTWAEIFGFKVIDLNSSKSLYFDFIINTVPELIFSKSVLNKINKKCLIIDLASIPGVDFEYAKKINIKTKHEFGIPGRFFPKTAAEIIKKIIYKYLEA